MKTKRKICLLLACVVVFICGCATTIYIRIKMRVDANPRPQETVAAQIEGQPARTVEQILTTYYPQSLPEGYSCVSGSGDSAVVRHLTFKNDKGTDIIFAISTSLDFGDSRLVPPVEKKEVTVSGQSATLTIAEVGAQSLIWENAEIGFYASLLTEDMGVDLVAMAESIGEGEPLELSFCYNNGELEVVPSQQAMFTVEMEQGNNYVGYEPWYPQWLPEGYTENFIDDRAYGEQEIRYENANGDTIQYIFYFRPGGKSRQFESMEQPEQVDINGHTGYRFDKSVIWTDDARGFGFKISAPDDVDILKIARSVAFGEEPIPTNAGKTEEALKELGDYQITALPEGMVEDGLAGWPLEGSWYAYVRRWYFNKQTHAQIYFTYETYVTDNTASPKAVCETMLGGSQRPLEEVTISGHDGYAMQYKNAATVAWAFGDSTQEMVFKLYSEELTTEELVQIAQSIEKLN